MGEEEGSEEGNKFADGLAEFIVDGDELGGSLKSSDGDIDNSPDGVTLGESLNASVGIDDGAPDGNTLDKTLGLSVDDKVGNKVDQDDGDSEGNLLGGCEKAFLFCVGFGVGACVGEFVATLIED